MHIWVLWIKQHSLFHKAICISQKGFLGEQCFVHKGQISVVRMKHCKSSSHKESNPPVWLLHKRYDSKGLTARSETCTFRMCSVSWKSVQTSITWRRRRRQNERAEEVKRAEQKKPIAKLSARAADRTGTARNNRHGRNRELILEATKKLIEAVQGSGNSVQGAKVARLC